MSKDWKDVIVTNSGLSLERLAEINAEEMGISKEEELELFKNIFNKGKEEGQSEILEMVEERLDEAINYHESPITSVLKKLKQKINDKINGGIKYRKAVCYDCGHVGIVTESIWNDGVCPECGAERKTGYDFYGELEDEGFKKGIKQERQRIFELIEDVKKENIDILSTNDFWNGALERLKQKIEGDLNG